MKKLLIIALVLTFAAGSAIARQQGGPGSPGGGNGNFGNPVEQMTESLGLDEAQAAAITLIFEDNQLLREEAREQARAMEEEMRVNTHAQILELLTPEQAALFEAQLQEREAFRQELEEFRADRGFGGGRGTGGCNR